MVAGSANISTRSYIYFLPYPLPPSTPIPYSPGLPQHNPLNLSPIPSEPTSTLVLTSPKSTFIDIRILKPLSAAEPLAPNTGGNQQRLEWGFAGTSKSYALEAAPAASSGRGVDVQDVTHSVWSHWVDSKHAVGSADIPVDEGDMYALADGRVLEFGTAFNAQLGRMQNYEEMWGDVPVAVCAPEEDGKKIAVVLRTENAALGVRGMIIRLGQFCQGIVVHKTNVSVERWEYVEGSWKRTVKIGDSFLPCMATFQPETMAVGKKVKYAEDGTEWVVEELSEWV